MKRRVFYVDAVRCFACFLVVTSHVFAPVCAAMNDYPRPVWWVFNLFDSLIRPSAALFIMISGKLFLGSSREESYFRFVWNRYSRLFLPFFTWSMIYAFYDSHNQNLAFHFSQALLQFFQGPTAYHLWFMYLILELYWVMPAMRYFVRRYSQAAIVTGLGVWMGFLIVEFLYPQYIPFNPITMLLSYSGYALLGYALDKADVLHKNVVQFFIAGLAIILFNAAATYLLTIQNGGSLNEKFYFGAAPLVALQAAAMFLLLKNVDEESVFYKNSRLRRVIELLGRNSYNIYLNHALLIWLLTRGTLGFILSEDTGPNPWVGVPLTTAAVLACSLGLSVLLQRIPAVSNFFVIKLHDPKAVSSRPV